MVGTSNLGSWNGHWLPGVFPPNFQTHPFWVEIDIFLSIASLSRTASRNIGRKGILQLDLSESRRYSSARVYLKSLVEPIIFDHIPMFHGHNFWVWPISRLWVLWVLWVLILSPQVAGWPNRRAVRKKRLVVSGQEQTTSRWFVDAHRLLHIQYVIYSMYIYIYILHTYTPRKIEFGMNLVKSSG